MSFIRDIPHINQHYHRRPYPTVSPRRQARISERRGSSSYPQWESSSPSKFQSLIFAWRYSWSYQICINARPRNEPKKKHYMLFKKVEKFWFLGVARQTETESSEGRLADQVLRYNPKDILQINFDWNVRACAILRVILSTIAKMNSFTLLKTSSN